MRPYSTKEGLDKGDVMAGRTGPEVVMDVYRGESTVWARTKDRLGRDDTYYLPADTVFVVYEDTVIPPYRHSSLRPLPVHSN